MPARYVHWGATSQDVIDTGLVLQLRAALNHTQRALSQLTAVFAQQAHRYQHTVMPGRTWMQQALPVTWGLKLAGTLDALLRWQERLQPLLPRVLVLQFGGAAGTLASLGQNALPVAERLAQELALTLPDSPWHTQRDRLLEVGAWYAGVGGTLGKFAQDFALLMQTGSGGSERTRRRGSGRLVGDAAQAKSGELRGDPHCHAENAGTDGHTLQQSVTAA